MGNVKSPLGWTGIEIPIKSPSITTELSKELSLAPRKLIVLVEPDTCKRIVESSD